MCIRDSVTQEPGIKIETNLFYLPDNEQNLAHKAARLLMEEFGIRQGPVSYTHL